MAKKFLPLLLCLCILTCAVMLCVSAEETEGEATETTVADVPFNIVLSEGTNNPTSYVTASNLSGYIGGGPGNTLRMNSNDDFFEVKINVTTPGTYYLSALVARGTYSTDKKLKFEVKEIEDSAIQHVIQLEAHHSVASEDIGTFTFTEAGEYTIRVSDIGTQLFGANYQNHTTFIRSIALKEKLAAPTGIAVSGLTFSDLDPTESYAIAPYTILGADDTSAVTITGKDTVDVMDYFADAAGLYAIYFKGDDTHLSSDAGAVCYVAGDFAGRETIGNMKSVNYKGTQPEDGDGNGILDEYNETFSVPSGRKTAVAGAPLWILGEYTGADYYYGFDNKTLTFKDYGYFKADYMYYTKYSVDDYNAAVTYEGLSETEQAEATPPAASSAEILESVKDTYRSVKIRYAYDTDDIIPISEVISIKFGVYGRAGGAYSFSFDTAKAKYVFHVMDETGEITEVTYISSEAVDHTITGHTYETVTVADIEGIPTEGWLVGWEYYPFGALETTEIKAKSSSTSNTRLGLTFTLPNLMSSTHYAIKGVKTPPYKWALSVGLNNPTEDIISSKLSGYIGSINNTLKMNANDDYFEFKVNVTTPGTYSVYSELSKGLGGSPKTLTVEIVGVSDSAVTHKINHVGNWSVKEEYIGALTFEKRGEYTIRVSDGGNNATGGLQPHTTNISSVTFKEKHPPLTDIIVDGTTFSGLDSTKSYVLAPYTISGVDNTNSVTITGKETVDVNDYFTDAVGLYGLCIQGYDLYVDSDPVVLYIESSYEAKKDIVFSADGKYNIYPVGGHSTDFGAGVWSAGNITVSKSMNGTVDVPYTYINSNTTPGSTWSTWFLAGSTDDEVNATQLSKIRYAYAYNPDEIVPVDELMGMKFSFGKQQGALTATAKAKVNFVVLNTDGTISNHAVMSDEYTYPNLSYKVAVNVQNATTLPEEGWILGFEIYPFGELIDFPKSTSFSNVGFYFAFSKDDYVLAEGVSVPTVEKHEYISSGVHLVTNTFKVTNYSDLFEYVYAYGENVEDAPTTGWTAFENGSMTATEPAKYIWVKRLGGNGLSESAPVVAVTPSEDVVATGTSLVLDGKIGIKINFKHTNDVQSVIIHATRVQSSPYKVIQSGIAEYGVLNEDGTGYVVLPIEAKAAGYQHFENQLAYFNSEGVKRNTSGVGHLSVYSMVEEYKADPTCANLVSALETYYLAAADYFDDNAEAEIEVADLSTEERADLTDKRARNKTGVITDTLEFYSTSLILEDNTTIRHYFKLLDTELTEDDLTTYFQVEGGSDLAFATTVEGADAYVYVDVKDIASNELSGEKTINVNCVDRDETGEVTEVFETITVTFSALDYVDLSLNDEDIELQNLVKALYRYSVASDNYSAQ